jgi:hypothetical protein
MLRNGGSSLTYNSVFYCSKLKEEIIMFNSLKDAFKKATAEKDNKGLTKLINDISIRQDQRTLERKKEREEKNGSKENRS